MGGGAIQLVAWGNQNKHLMGNPSITFFKKVYKTHTNFSMESIVVPFNKTYSFINQNTILKAKLPRNGDLIMQIYFVFELPPITNNVSIPFKWISSIGEAVISNVTLSIGNVIIDNHSGEYINIRHNISSPIYKKRLYDKLIGNIDILNQSNNQNEIIPKYTCYVPLQFYFNKNVSNALPIIALQYMDVDITIDIRPVNEWYQLFYKNINTNNYEYRAPNIDNTEHAIKKYINNESVNYIKDSSILEINARLEVNYVFLDKNERDYFIHKPLEYLIEQTVNINNYKLSTYNILEYKLNNPVKEFLWVFRRSDVYLKNTWFDYLDDKQHIMVKARFMFNGVDRIQDKDYQYYNYIIPYQHYNGEPIDGVYCYTFALYPDEGLSQPSGSCNFSRIDKLQFVTTLKNVDGDYTYDLLFFAKSYNILKINGGIASLYYSI